MMTGSVDAAPPVSAKEKRARLAEHLRRASKNNFRCPVSCAQERLLFLDQLQSNSALYNVPSVARLTGALNVPALERALQGIVARHEALRTRFDCSGEAAVQVVSAEGEFKLRVIEAGEQAETERLVREEIRRPFNLTGAELFVRALLIRLHANEHLLALNLHHIVADEWSLKTLFRELEEFYNAEAQGRPARLPELPIQYSDYAAWQREWLKSDSFQRQLQYWTGKLAGKPPVTELLTDHPHGAAPTFEGRTMRRTLGGDLALRLKQLAAEKGATLFMVVLAAFKALVHRYAGLDDIIIGTPIAGRNRLETEGLIGFFVNTLLLRTRADGNPAFEELLQRVRSVAIEAYAHQDLPLEKLVEALRPDRSLTHLPFTRIMFALQTKSGEMTSLDGLTVEWLEADTGTAKFDMTFVVQDFSGDLVAHIEYNSNLFDTETIERLLGHFENLLRGIAENSAQRLSELPLLNEAEKRRLLVEWNDNATDYPRQKCIHELFESRVRERPDAMAVVFGAEALTYRELNARANRLAHFLGRNRVDPGAPVAVCMERSAQMAVAMLAILKAGGTYLPLDPEYPKERLAFMLADSGAAIVLTQKTLLARFSRRGLKTFCMDVGAEWASESPENPSNRAASEDVAYINYTSGSTGQPKGVAVPHRAVNRLVLRTNYIELDSSDRIAQISNISFDAATFEIWGALLNGGQLRGIASDVALSPVDFARELREQGITAMFLTSALFSQLAGEVPGVFSTLRTLIAGGEALDPNAVRAVLAKNPPLRLVNGYGPTENTTFTCCALLRDIPGGALCVPIGRPISNTQVYILDAHRNPVPVGVPGELYTGGDGLARGYWNRPALTAEKFVLHQFSTGGSCHRLYRTGDLARHLPNGSIEFLGRVDDQVKIRGFRVELGEIEAVLGRHKAVRECAVKASGTGAGKTRLTAYFVPNGRSAPKTSQLREFLKDQLPDYMVPSAFVELAALPLTPNGKVDKRALPEADGGRPQSERRYASPRDAVELELTRIWEDVLGVKPIGIEDNFFELGGHSLLAMRLAGRLEKAFGRKLMLAAIFTAPTIEQLAAVLRDHNRGHDITSGTSLVALQAKGTRPPLFLVHGAGGGMFWGYVNLARRLGPEQPVFGFSSRGLDGGAEFGTIEEMAAKYVNDLRVVQPRGPYYLGGYCFGGNVAYEMARQIESEGEKVALLALLNCAPPNSRYMLAHWTPAWCARFIRNLFYWADYCRQWTAPQRRDFLRWKWGRFKQWFTRWTGAAPGGRANEGEDLIDLSSMSEQERELWLAHIRALMNFHPQPYSGRVHLFRSPGHPLWCSFEPDYGWGELAREGVGITIVRGAHEKILEEPWVDETAAELNKVLEQNREGDLEFWKRELAGAPALLELPADHPRAGVRNYSTCELIKPLPKMLVVPMEAEEGTILALAALNVVLQRYTGQDDILVGAEAGGNAEPENVLVLRTSLAGNPTGRELLDRVRAVRTAALQHGDLPFKKLCEELCPNSDPSYHPLVQILFARGSRPDSEQFDLRISVVDDEPGCALCVQYAADLFDRATIRRMLGHLEMTLQHLVESPERRLAELSILTPAEEKLVLMEWNRTERDYPRDKTLFRLFAEQAARTPETEALVCGASRLTYRELSERANRVAKHLLDLGVGRDALVGICLERSEDMVAGILGTLQAGGAYVPLDPAYPKARLEFIVKDAGMRAVLTRKKLRDLLPGVEAPLLCVEDFNTADDSAVPACAARPPDLAYVLYTSGSTGQPKGVALEHRNAVALVSWARDVFDSSEISGVLASTSICFDLSVFELFVPLSWGGKIILADNALALPELPAANEVTLINTVPSAIRELLRVDGVPSSVQVVNLAGEPLSATLVEQIYRETPVRKVYDLYGPTETTTYSTFTLRQPGEPPTIGRPLANEQVYILDKQMQPTPVGIPGGVYIGGAGLARGYLNRPEMTAERFLPHPFKPGGRIYRTGDIARWREDGNLVFLGRSDHQVKIRGFRIELGEVESALKAHRGVAEAVVIAREDRPGEKRLAAYIVAAAKGEVGAEELRRAVREKLPEHMTPASFDFLPKLPLTPNGKVDRNSLPVPQLEERETNRDFVKPRDGVETQVAGIWGEVLGFKMVGATDDFFELGGHSLLAIQVISRLRSNFNAELPLSCLFEARTVESLASGIAAGRWKQNGNPVFSLEPIPRGEVLPASFIQEQLWFLNQLEPDSDAYNVPAAIRLKGRLDMKALQESLDLILQRHEALRTTLQFADGNLSQSVAPSLVAKIGVVDLPGGNEAQMLERLHAEARRPFDLQRGPLIRAGIVRLNEMDHGLIIAMHHVVTDGWSLDIIFRELEAGYRTLAAGNSAPEFSALPVQYPDFAHWQRRRMQGDLGEKDLLYWKEHLDGAPLTLDLPTDQIGALEPGNKAARLAIELPDPLRAAVASLGQKEGATKFMILMTALAIVLQKWTGQNDMILGTVVAGRSRREIEGLVGCFMNFLPLRVKFAGLDTGMDLVRAVKAEVISGQMHQDYPFQKLVESIPVERRPGRNPFYNVALLFQNSPEMPQLGHGLECAPIPVHVDEALLDLRFEANETAGGIALMCEYKSDLFQAATIERLLSSFRSVLETLTQNSGAKISEFEVQTAMTRAQSETIAICGTFTAEPIEEPLRFWLDELGISGRINFAPYDQVFQQLLDPASLLGTNRQGLNVLLVRLDDWESPPANSESAGPSAFGHALKRNADEFVRAIQAATGRDGAPMLICFCPSPRAVADDPSRSQALADMEIALAAALRGIDGVYVSTTSELAAWYPVEDFDDPASEELGHIPYSPMFFTAVATLIARKLHAMRRTACKVIALDCDQTLWSGVCGEDGPKGIRLDSPRVSLQQFMRRQQELGKLLVICSKNDEADVNAVFAEGPPMPLKREHFATWRVNWQKKSENLKAMAKELKLGLDSFVFIDDNPVECAEVEANCPEVLTLQLPEETALIPQFLDHCWVFDQLKTTEEDLGRTEMYHQNQLREHLQSNTVSFADFIAKLELEVQITPIAPAQLARVAQLTQRTNQFNVSGRRRNEREMRQLTERRQVLTVSVRDRFGDYGLVGVMIFEIADQALVVDSFLLSCRALGRGVEHRMLSRLGKLAQERGVEWVDVPFERLPRNQPALDFLESIGASFGEAHQFRFPADVAATVEFNPAGSVPSARAESGAGASRRKASSRKFKGCRSIALESCNVAAVHERIEHRVALRPAAKGGYAAPGNEIERKLCALWQKVLRVERVGVEDDFFELGGHSLLAVRLFAEMEKMTGKKMPLVTLFQAPTIAALAAVLCQNEESGPESVLVPIQEHGSRPPLYLVHGAGGDVLWGYANLVAYMDSEQPIYALKSRGQTGGEEFHRVEDMAAFYLEALRAKQPNGPYFLGGYCFGGNVAYEMARQLRADHQEVALLALLDSAPANAGYESVQWWRPEFAGLFARNLYYWLRDFQGVKPQDRRRFIGRKLRTFGRRIKRWMNGTRGGRVVDLEEVIDPAHFPARELELWKIHLRALAEHVQQPYSGHVTLFRTRGHPVMSSFAQDLCWGSLVGGGVTVTMIPGSHENIFMEPHVKTLALAMTAALSEARARVEMEDNRAALQQS